MPPPRFPGSYSPPPRRPSAGRDPREVQKDGLRTNRDIRALQVRLVGEDGEMIGVVPIREALAAADEAGLDLVEISPQAEPPVCKILDYGKYKYEQDKKANEARKKQKVIEVKEIKLRPGIGDHDYNIKLKHAKEFLADGDKVKFTLRFRGREMSRTEYGLEVLNKVKQELEGLVRIEHEPKMEGRQVIMIVAPLPTVKQVTPADAATSANSAEATATKA